MLTKQDFEAIVDKIQYKDWRIRIGQNEEHFFLQILFDAPDNHTSVIEEQRCRKWQLSVHMTVSEVVRTAYKAVVGAEEHEIGEHFTYKGELIFNPHVDVETLVDIINRDRLDTRDKPAEVYPY